MENKLTEQEIQQILNDAEEEMKQAAAKVVRRKLEELNLILRNGKKPIVSENEAEALLDWMVESMTGLDGMVTRDFQNLFDFMCKHNGVKNTMNQTSISLRVKAHGYTIIDQKHKLLKEKKRVFKRI